MEQPLVCFADYLSVIGYSSGTQSMIGACVREFWGWGRYVMVDHITPVAIRDFYTWLHTRPLQRGAGGLSAMMISHYVYSLKVFFGWLQQSGRLPVNPMSGLQFDSPTRLPREPLTVVEVTALFEAAETLREQALLHVFYSAGLRRTEGVMLRTSDVHGKERLLYVRAGKGGRRRVVPLAARVATAFSTYLEQERGSGRSGAFLLSPAGAPMTGAQCLLLLKTLLERAGLPATITLHDLRRSVATHLLQAGMRAEQVRDFLGHQHLETTQLYARPAAAQILRV